MLAPNSPTRATGLQSLPPATATGTRGHQPPQPPALVSRKNSGHNGEREVTVDPVKRKAAALAKKRFRRELRVTMQKTMAGKNKRYRQCGHTPIGDVTVEYAGKGHSNLQGLATCGSKWVCPECAVSRLADDAAVLEALMAAHVGRGGAAAMITLTVSHFLGESLEAVSALEMGAWTALTSDRAWKGKDGIRKRYGVTLAPAWGRELTYSDKNGWHPHHHVLLLLDRELSEVELAALQAEMYEIWRRKVTKLGGRAPHPVKGVDVAQVVAGEVDQAKAVASYVMKSNIESLAMEITAGMSTKDGKQGSRTMMQVLADIHAAETAGKKPKPRDVAIWEEFVRWVDAGNRTMSVIPPSALKALGVDKKQVIQQARDAARVEAGEEPMQPRVGVCTIPRAEWLVKLADRLDRQEELLSVVAAARDALAAGLAAVGLLEGWGVEGARAVNVALDPVDLDAVMPSRVQAFARDLGKAVWAGS